MRLRETVVLVLLGASAACAKAPDAVERRERVVPAPEEPRPVVVLLRHSVWFDAVNLPLFILYEDGRVIVPRRLVHGLPQSYQTARIDFREPDSALARLGVAVRVRAGR